ncbi:LacI family DNA-binding transcriptional regulator [Ruania rhizosphaerae]|uniref:LacI family DNA-binding transcriptional regulator n=1 Tax=Ruania rhizosphaerae TaxID=1840413 RepID=UPI001358B24D|nr:LacI family DNA-binding transcriptional regulator [Ruania rhizosphaerae]
MAFTNRSERKSDPAQARAAMSRNSSSTRAGEGRPRGRRPTIEDIAREAGVSKATVSRSLSGEPGVSTERRKAIVALARARGWRPNSAAQALSRGQTGTLGWTVRQTPKTATVDPYFLDLFVGVQLALKGTPFDVLVKLVGSASDEIRQHTEWVTERRVDGIFLSDVERDDPRLGNLADSGIAVGCIVDDLTADQRVTLPDDRVARVDPRNAEGVALVVDHLVRHGHRTIVWVLGPAELVANVERRRALTEWSHRSPEHTLVIANASLDRTEGVHRAVREVLGHDATAVVVDNDAIASDTITTLRASGLRVPQDVAVVSWLGSRESQTSESPITALEYRVTDVGARWAAVMMRTAYPTFDSLGAVTEPRVEPPALTVGWSSDVHRAE